MLDTKMQYFNSLPKVQYTNTNGVSTIYTNLLARASIIPNLLNNTLNFYDYDIQDGDTPEIVAYKYYGDSYRYWVVLYVNQMNDAQWDWPLEDRNFREYMSEKYTGNTAEDVHHFEKTITQTNRTSGTDYDIKTTTNSFSITEEEYTELQNAGGIETNTYVLPTGSVDITIESRIVTNYTYELELNEAKRSIKLLNKAFIDQFEKDFMDLMK